MKWRTLAAAAPLLFVGLTDARAQGGDPVAAAELFRQGRAALLEKRYDVACPALAESERLDPKVGTLINLALCDEATVKPLAAMQRWDEAAKLARATSDARESYALERRAAIEPHVPIVVVRFVAGVPPGTEARLDGAMVTLGVATSLEVGAHVVVVTAPGRAERRYPVDARDGASSEIAVEPAAGPAHAPAPPPPRVPDEPAPAGGAQRAIAYAVGGLGVVGIGVGSAFGVQAINAKNDSRCQNGVCDAAGAQAQRDGIDAGNRATVLFIAGGALVVGGVAIWLSAPRSRAKAQVAVAPAPGGATVGVGVTF